ncbi:hypothetical protein [Janibacter sp. G56]|uniref:aggregation-promoting factor C-terminal-like domain-containing protein n=1 Tax=Janibacter sp. G56 TaxID=3418717 RepID=UPI003CFF0B43
MTRPAMGAGVALAIVVTGGATMAAGDPGHESTTASDALDSATLKQMAESSRASLADTSRINAERDAVNVSRSVERERVEAEKKAKAAKAKAAKAAAEAKAKAAAAKRAAEAKARKAAAAAKAAKEQASLAAVQANPKPTAQRMLAEMGFGADQWGCLEQLWIGESDWNYAATNSSSGAYGIPQSLPASKMASAGADWQTNPATQIRWGLDYIKQSYGTPCGALNFWNSNSPHWY